MEIQRFGLWDDILGHNYGFWSRLWLKWALTPPENNGVKDHPLKEFDTGTNAVLYGGLPGKKGDNLARVLFLGGYWEGDEDEPALQRIINDGYYFQRARIVRRVNDFPANVPILINAVSSAISPEEHPDAFGALASDKDYEYAAKNVIDQSYSVIRIKCPDGDIPEFHSYKGTLDRVRCPVHNPTVRAGMWHHFEEDREIRAALDGYWLFLRGLEAAESPFIIHIDSYSPYFDRTHAHNSPHDPFEVHVTYELYVR